MAESRRMNSFLRNRMRVWSSTPSVITAQCFVAGLNPGTCAIGTWRKRVRPALANSYEASFHDVDAPNFLLPLRDSGPASIAFRDPRLERAIGVIYLPQTERQSHYFEARLSDQFDAVIHFDETHALEPLERFALWETGEPPETFPTGM